MSKKPYRTHSSALKVQLLRKHLLDKIPVSQLCEEHSIKPSVFYSWQKDLFERGSMVFDCAKKAQVDSRARQIKQLETKLIQKNEILAELMQEHINLKKKCGEI
jgi:transposase-like protein